MEEQLSVELERVKMTNYIVQKENEILLETVSSLSAEKADLLKQLENAKRGFFSRAVGKSKRVAKKILRRK